MEINIFPKNEFGDFQPILASIAQSRNVKGGVGRFERCCIQVMLFFISNYVRFRLGIRGPRHSEVDRTQRIDEVYSKLAAQYEEKHRRSTNGRDIWWRREAGFDVAWFLNAQRRADAEALPSLLDIGTGIGLSIEEMLRVFRLAGTSVRAIGIDFNETILVQAKETILPRIRRDGLVLKGCREVEFIQADATCLLGVLKELQPGLVSFDVNSIACTTNIFAIGGIVDPLASFEQQLAILEPGGLCVMLDVHRPLSELVGRWPLSYRKSWPAFEQFAWDEVTVPLVLRELWAWEDPTLHFYTLPLVTHFDPMSQIYYGFAVLSHQIRTEPWWFGMPVMTIAKILVKKVQISRHQSEKRIAALSLLRQTYLAKSEC